MEAHAPLTPAILLLHDPANTPVPVTVTPTPAPTPAPVIFYHYPYPHGSNRPPVNTHPVDRNGSVATLYMFHSLMYRLQLPVYVIENGNWATAHPSQLNIMNRNILFMWLATVYQDAIEVLRQLDELHRQACRSEWDLERMLLSLKKARIMQDGNQRAQLLFLALKLAEEYKAPDLQTALTRLTKNRVTNHMKGLKTTKDKKMLKDLKDCILSELADQEYNLNEIFTVLLR